MKKPYAQEGYLIHSIHPLLPAPCRLRRLEEGKDQAGKTTDGARGCEVRGIGLGG